MRRHELSDEQFKKIEPILPGRKGHLKQAWLIIYSFTPNLKIRMNTAPFRKIFRQHTPLASSFQQV